ncbi:MAG: hypothetical protein ACLRFL_01225 [Clostridia bacterium]
MSKFRIINLIDKLFISITTFLIIFAWINFYIRSLWTSFIFSLIFSASILFLLNYLINKKRTKTNQKKENIAKINDNFLYFFLTPYEEKLKLLHSILSIDYSSNLKHNMLTYTKDNQKHLLIVSKNFNKLTNSDTLELIQEYRDLDCEVIDIICSEFESNINTKIFKNKEINLINKTKLYNDFFEKYNTFPTSENIDKNVNKLTLKSILKNFFLPQKAKSYFFCGLLLIFSSLIIPYNAYYIIVGSMLLTFSLICKLRTKFDI